MPDVALSPSFEEKIKSRLRDSIGELISDEDLRMLLTRSIEELFFKPRTKQISSWETRVSPSLIEEMTRELLQSRMDALLKTWLQEHETELNTALHATITQGVGTAVITAITRNMQAPLDQFRVQVQSAFASMANGNPPTL